MRGWAWRVGLFVSAFAYAFLMKTPRADTATLLSLWAGVFLLYGLVFRFKPETEFKFLIRAAIVLRLIALAALPTLSDDVYRFIWDGRLLAHGYNPFLYLPSEILTTPIAVQAGLTDALFQKLNSPDYYTVYPPLLQGWFAVAGTLGGTNDLATVFWLRLPILLGEVGTFWLLYRLLILMGKDDNTTRRGVLLYSLNPVVIVELVGNVHYEGLTICFLLAGLYFYKKQKDLPSATFLGLAAGVKLLPLIFLPALLEKNKVRKNLRYVLVAGIIFVVPFLSFFDAAIVENLSTSLNLYFRRFEFNASVYYLLREAGTLILGYNPIALIGPFLALVALSLILFFSWSQRVSLSLSERWLFVLTTYLLCATTVHPWYVVPLIALSVLTRFGFPIIWSVLLPLTYLAYGEAPFYENLWVVAVEYVVVGGWMAWEVRGLVDHEKGNQKFDL